MQNAETLLRVIHQCGTQGKPLKRLYRHLFNRELFLVAYGRLARNRGAMTAGATDETADGMTLAKIDAIIQRLRTERYRWTPVRRVTIPKAGSRKRRPLGLPTWSDKLVQEVLRLLLEAYYEPQFSRYSHGFRPERGCHTALMAIQSTWTGTAWLIEGDIRQCFDSLDHQILLNCLADRIHDGRFLRLIGDLLRAGYVEDWRWNASLSGTPQGGVLSPLLANIYLDRLDQFVETQLIPRYTMGKRRRNNPRYYHLQYRARMLASRGDHQQVAAVKRVKRTLPIYDTHDPAYRRLRYIRYADDFLLGFCGPRAEAEQIKAALHTFLGTTLKLELSEQKTVITQARTEQARFLGYDISVKLDNRVLTTGGRRRINGQIRLGIPREVIQRSSQRYMQHGKPIHLMERTTHTAFSTVAEYQQEYRGIVEYYQLAGNIGQLNKLRWIMEQSLVKTLARKFKVSVPRIYARYATYVTTPYGRRKVLLVRVEREGKPALQTHWGGIPLRRRKKAILVDQPRQIWNHRTELVERLLADTCELCNAQLAVEVHHIRRLADLQTRGQRPMPYWKQIMAARHRKTLVVCRPCHQAIHAGERSH